MSPMLRKDFEYIFEYILPKLSPEEQQSAQDILSVIEGVIDGRKGAYSLKEIEGAIKELRRESALAVT